MCVSFENSKFFGIYLFFKLIHVAYFSSFSIISSRKLYSSSEIVRKKAVAALHSIFLVDPSSMESMISTVRRVFCDKHPSVMAATLGLFLDMAKVSLVWIRNRTILDGNGDMVRSYRIINMWMMVVLIESYWFVCICWYFDVRVSWTEFSRRE